ncbi:MAG: ATP-binding cassette domain-containing protein, partial [Mesorhizobium sp.]
MAKDCVTFSDLTLGYGSHAAVHHLTGSLERGSLTAIVGANGSGKSTLLKGIASLLKPMSGHVDARADGPPAYLAQRAEIDMHFPAQVRDLVEMGLWRRRGLLGRTSSADRERVAGAIATVGLDGFEGRDLDTLSGGQLQRALFARVIVQD